MEKKKRIFLPILSVITLIMVIIGTTFAYFAATVSSEEEVLSAIAADFEIDLVDDTTLVKTSLIPSEEIYVDYGTKYRIDDNGDYIKPYIDENGNTVKAYTTCIDDNLNEICSLYTFTVQNFMTEYELPVSATLIPSVNTFENLYFKVLDSNQNEVMSAQKIVDDRECVIDENGKKVCVSDSKMSSIHLNGIDATLPKATINEETQEIVPTEVTYSIIMWVNETNSDQTKADSQKVFAGSLLVESKNNKGQGITAVLTAGGKE